MVDKGSSILTLISTSPDLVLISVADSGWFLGFHGTPVWTAPSSDDRL